MIFFGPVEMAEGYYLGHDFSVVSFAALEFFLNFFGYLLLFVIMIENDRAVIGADIGPLTVKLGWIVKGKKLTDKLFVADHLRVEDHLNGFSMAGFSGANLLIGRIGCFSPAIASNG